MKIKFKNDSDVTFLNINVGEIFKICEDEDVFMKIPCVECRYPEYGNIPFKESNAISLINGELFEFSSDEIVTPLNVSFIGE